MTRFLPSAHPYSRRCPRRSAQIRFPCSAPVVLNTPMRYIRPYCCAPAASGAARRLPDTVLREGTSVQTGPPPDRPCRRDRAKGRPSGVTLHLRGGSPLVYIHVYDDSLVFAQRTRAAELAHKWASFLSSKPPNTRPSG